MSDMADVGHGRRRFIAGATAATVTVAGGGFGGYWLLTGDDGPRRRARTTAEIDHALLRPLAGDPVRMTGVSGAFAAYMADVTEPATYRSDDGVTGTSFSVLIESDHQIGEGIYEFEHAGVGTFPMFIAPVDLPIGGTFTYEAVFNRLD